jgi:co-chaperonin GroES (HSP10)
MAPGSLLAQEFERKTDSKVHLPDSVKDKGEWGTKEFIVIDVGEGRMLDSGAIKPMPVKKGDRIMFLFNQALAFTIKGRVFRAMPMEAVMGIEDATVMSLFESEDIRKLIASTEGPHQ